MASSPLDPNSILRAKKVQALIGISRSTLWRMCRRSEFPQPRKITERLIGWRASEVLAWIEAREPGSASEAENGGAATDERHRPSRAV